MAEIAAIAFCVLMGGLAVFQGVLIAGAPLGRFAWGGQERVLSRGKRVGSAVSILLYVVFAVIVLERGNVVPTIGDPWIPAIGIWLLFAYFVLGVVMNALSRSRAERWTMAPLSLVLAALTFIVALS